MVRRVGDGGGAGADDGKGRTQFMGCGGDKLLLFYKTLFGRAQGVVHEAASDQKEEQGPRGVDEEIEEPGQEELGVCPGLIGEEDKFFISGFLPCYENGSEVRVVRISSDMKERTCGQLRGDGSGCGADPFFLCCLFCPGCENVPGRCREICPGEEEGVSVFFDGNEKMVL